MKNISLWFVLAASAIILGFGASRGHFFQAASTVFLAPPAIITMFLSPLLKRGAAHVLNIIPAALYLALPVAFILGEQASFRVFAIAMGGAPLFVIGFIGLWITALWIGTEEIPSPDARISDGGPARAASRMVCRDPVQPFKKLKP